MSGLSDRFEERGYLGLLDASDDIADPLLSADMGTVDADDEGRLPLDGGPSAEPNGPQLVGRTGRDASGYPYHREDAVRESVPPFHGDQPVQESAGIAESYLAYGAAHA